MTYPLLPQTPVPIPPVGKDPVVSNGDGVPSARAFASAARAEATRRAYRSDLALFTAWCERHAQPSLPAGADAVAVFLAAEANAGRKPSTLIRRLAAIRYAHELAGLPTPTGDAGVRATLAGIRRLKGSAPVQKAPATAERLTLMVNHCVQDLAGRRDRALLLLGFAAALRRSELVALEVRDLEVVGRKGLLLHIRRSKTDQEGAGQVVPIARGGKLCPVRAVHA